MELTAAARVVLKQVERGTRMTWKSSIIPHLCSYRPMNKARATVGTMSSAQPPAPVRAIGPLALTAIAVNSIVGAGIFALPANVAQLLGPSSLIGYGIAGVAVLLVVLCFAEAGSQFDSSGGPYLYARSTLGSFWGFQAGWMLVLSRVAGGAAISNTFCTYLGFLWRPASSGIGRALVLTVLIAVLTWVNYRGVRSSVWVIGGLTIGKLVPLVAFCIVGLFFLDRSAITLGDVPQASSLQQATLLLTFAFGGFEYATIPSEEVFDPRRTVPRALLTAVIVVVFLYVTIQIVAMGTLPGLASSSAPLAEAARIFMGPVGGILLTLGALFSTSGTTSASIFVGPRTLYSMAQAKQLPEAMGRLHARYHTPALATILFSIAMWAFALAGTFTLLAAVAALARVYYYSTTSLAVPILRRNDPSNSTRFALPGGWLIPALSTIVCLWLASGSTWNQAVVAGGAMIVGSVVYLFLSLSRDVANSIR
jgi:basic amino acid/polyamine antiporter, APA family